MSRIRLLPFTGICLEKDVTFYSAGVEDRLPPNIGFTLGRDLAMFTRSAITPLKVNRFR